MQVLSKVAETWSRHLSVIPVADNITVANDVCFGSYAGKLSNETLRYGVNDADLVVIVSAQPRLNAPGGVEVPVCGGRILALASHCTLDQFDRPVLGFVNFCLPLMTLNAPTNETLLQELNQAGFNADDENVNLVTEAFHPDDVDDTTNVAVHELGHILGMDSHLFKFFRDPATGEPLTRRPFQRRTVKCADGSSRVLVFASEATLQWNVTSEGLHYFDVVTPHVATVVRNHFNCPALHGARLENQRLFRQCIGTHWDERLFLTEMMGQRFSGEADILSPLTLAFMEDTGWYQVSYRNVSLSPFGRGLGCDFVNEPCIVNDTVPIYARGSFCDVPIEFDGNVISSASLQQQTCDPTHTAFALCDLWDSQTVPADFVTLPTNPLHYFSDVNLVPSFIQADYCPLPIREVGVDCTKTADYVPFFDGEAIGPSSGCVNAYREGQGSTRTNRPACVPMQCDDERRKLVVGASTFSQTCEFDGQILRLGHQNSTDFFECPRLATICPHFYCPADCSGRGTCLWTEEVPRCSCFDPEDISDGCFGDYAPSQVPSAAPTALESASPSQFPTPVPSQRPTSLASFSPSAATSAATSAPSLRPVVGPASSGFVRNLAAGTIVSSLFVACFV